MAGTRTSSHMIAQRYVSAIFDLTEGKDKTLGAFDRFFAALESLLADKEGLAEAFANPTVSRKTKAEVARDIAAVLKAGKEEANFLELLARNNRLEILPAIIADFRERYAAYKGEVVLEITTAHPADKAALASIQGAVEKETGKTTVLKTHEDPALLGGIVIKFGSTLLDCSVEGRLARMEQSLKQQIANA